MNKIYKLIVGLIIGLLLLVIPRAASAEDMRVVCSNEGYCDIEFGDTLFNENSLAPGQSVSRQIMVVNQDDDDNCDLTLYIRDTSSSPSPDDLSSRLFTAIREGDNILYGIPDGNIATNDKTIKDLLVYGGPLSLGSVPHNENRFINWIVTFDSSADNDYQEAEATFDFDISFVCGSPPGEGGTGGGGDVAGTSASSPPAFFRTLGALFGEGDEGEDKVEEEGEVEGVVAGAACEDEYCRWWLPLVIQVILALIYLWFIRRKKEETKRWWLFPFLLVILSQVGHGILSCNCATGEWCSRYWLLNLVVLMISLLIYYFFRRRKK